MTTAPQLEALSQPSGIPFTAATRVADREQLLATIVSTVWELTFACLGKRIRVTLLEQMTHPARGPLSPTLPG